MSYHEAASQLVIMAWLQRVVGESPASQHDPQRADSSVVISNQPLPARTLTEAQIWLDRHDCVPVLHEVRPTGRREIHELLCLEGSETSGVVKRTFRIPAGCYDSPFGDGQVSRILNAREWLDHAESLVSRYAREPTGLVPTAVDEALQDLDLARHCALEAARLTPACAPSVRSIIRRMQAFASAREQGTGRVALGTFDDGSTLSSRSRRRLDGALGRTLEDLGGGLLPELSEVNARESTPGLGLFRHGEGAMVWADERKGRIASIHVMEGIQAIDLFTQHGMRMPARRRLQLRAALARGQDVQRQLVDALLPGEVAEQVADIALDRDVLRFMEVHGTDGRWKVLLSVVIEAGHMLRGYRVWEGRTALEQLDAAWSWSHPESPYRWYALPR